MKSKLVRDVMVSPSAFATVSDTATLLEVVNALRKAQTDVDRPQTILVIDGSNRIAGSVNPHDVIEALEPNYVTMRDSVQKGALHRVGFSDDFVTSTIEQYHLWEKALENLCAKALNRKVGEFMHAPHQDEFVNVDASLDEAIHRLILGRHHALLVTGQQHPHEIVGVLRLTDVFGFIGDAMQTCTT